MCTTSVCTGLENIHIKDDADCISSLNVFCCSCMCMNTRKNRKLQSSHDRSVHMPWLSTATYQWPMTSGCVHHSGVLMLLEFVVHKMCNSQEIIISHTETPTAYVTPAAEVYVHRSLLCRFIVAHCSCALASLFATWHCCRFNTISEIHENLTSISSLLCMLAV